MASAREFWEWRLRQAIGWYSSLRFKEEAGEVRRILAIVEGGLGDRLMALPALRHLRASHPDAAMTVCLSGPVPFLDGEFDEVLDWSDTSFVRKCRTCRQGFDLCFVSAVGVYNPSDELLALLSGAPLRVGPTYSSVRRSAYNVPYIHDGVEHQTVINARAVGYGGAAAVLAYPLSPGRSADVPDIGAPVVIHPGCRAGYEAKQWPPAHYRELARLVHDNAGRQVVVVGAPSENALVHEVAHGLAGAKPVVTKTVEDLARVLLTASVFVGNDSGPAHLAAALGTPTVVLMSATDPARCAPVGDRVRVIHEPCDLGGCYYVRGARCRGCIQRILPTKVAQVVAARRQLDRSGEVTKSDG